MMRHKNVLYKFAAYVCVLSLVFALIAPVTASADKGANVNPDEALIIFEKELKTVNVDRVIKGSSTMASHSVTSDDIDIWKFKASGNNPYLYIDLPNSFGNSYNDGSVYDVEIKYFDSNTGYAIVWYDAIKWGKQVAYELYATATNTWKTAKFTIDNAYFKNGVDEKGDIMLSFKETGWKLATTPFPVDIASIRITRRPKANPIIAESYVDAYGNVFAYYSDTKTVHNEIRNTTNKKQQINVEYSLVDTEFGDKVFSKTEPMTISANETVKTDINIETERCGEYNWYVRIVNDEGTIDSVFKEDIIAIIKTDPNGIKSETQGIVTHSSRWRSDSSHALIELVAAANFGEIRQDLVGSIWENLERVPGKFNINGMDKYMRALEHSNELGLKVLAMLKGSHAYYQGLNKMSGANMWMPDNEIAYDGYERYVEFLVKNLAPYVDYWEVWNEPNITSFNPNGGTPEDLTEITKRARRVIDKYDPGAPTIGMSITEIYRGDGIEWRDGLLEAGIVDGDKGMNALGMHTYHHNNSPEKSRIFDPAKECRDLALEYGKATGVDSMPVFVTEYGYTSADEFVSGENEVTYPIRQSTLLKAHGVGEHLFYYVLEDKGIIDSDREDNFGIVSSIDPKYNIEGKIAVASRTYAAFAGVNYVLGGHCEPDGTWELDNEIYLNRFKSDKFGKNVLTMWRDGEAESLSLDLGVDRVDYYDIYGNKETIYGKDGVFTFVVNGRPSYIVGSFKKNRVVDYSPVVEYSNLNITVPLDNKARLTVETNTDNDYEAVFSTHGANALSSNVKLEDGKAEFYVNADGNIGDKSALDVSIYENGKLICFNQIAVTVENALDSEISFEVADKGKVNSWNGKLKITNYCFDREAKGYVEFSEPTELAELGKIDIGTVAADSTKEVIFNIPNLVKKGIRNIAYKIIDENSQTDPVEFTTPYDFNIAVRPLRKVVIDGKADADEWPSGISMSAEAPANFVSRNNFVCKDANDKSANVSVMWDEENLYMYTEVTDDIYYQNETIEKSWNCDGVQFGLYVDIGEEEFTAIGQSNTNFHEYTIAINKDSDQAGVYKTKVQDDKTAIGMVEAEVKALRRGTITTYEWAIPWEQIVGIKGWHPESGQHLKFSMLWNDNDGAGRKGWIEYASGIGATKDNRLFTSLLFIE